MGSLTCLSTSKQLLAKEIQSLESKFIQLGILEKGGVLASSEVRSSFIEEFKAKEFEYEHLKVIRNKILYDKTQEINLDARGVLSFKGRICVPRVGDLIQNLFE